MRYGHAKHELGQQSRCHRQFARAFYKSVGSIDGFFNRMRAGRSDCLRIINDTIGMQAAQARSARRFQKRCDSFGGGPSCLHGLEKFTHGATRSHSQCIVAQSDLGTGGPPRVKRSEPQENVYRDTMVERCRKRSPVFVCVKSFARETTRKNLFAQPASNYEKHHAITDRRS